MFLPWMSKVARASSSIVASNFILGKEESTKQSYFERVVRYRFK